MRRFWFATLLFVAAICSTFAAFNQARGADFAVSATLIVSNGPVFVAAADLNNDGRVDLVCANYITNSLSVLTNNGSGGFVMACSVNTGGGPYSVAVADVNHDGKPDLISANSSDGTLTILTNNGASVFALAATISAGGIDPHSVIALDVNGDGRPDLITACQTASKLTVLTNNGSGGFATNAVLTVNPAPVCVTVADVNGDNRPDLITANHDDGSLSVLTNNGAGGFVASALITGTFQPSWVTAADISGDGKVDLISANPDIGKLTIFTNNGTGGFVLASTPSVTSGCRVVAAADVNGDGHFDLVTANYNANTLTILTNNGTGGFVTNSSPVVGSGPYFVAAADVDGDGRPDLVSANFNAVTMTVLTNNFLFPPPVLTNIVVSPAGSILVVGSNQQFTATGYFNNATIHVLTNGAAGVTNLFWSSSNTNVIVISTNGLATALSNGVTTITATSGSVSGNTSLTVYNDQNIASFTATPNPAVCNQVVSFDGSTSHNGDPRRTIVSYQWDFGDGNSGSGVTTTHVFNGFGSYSVKLTVTDDLNRTASTNVTVLVNQGDQAPTAASGGPYIIDVVSPSTGGSLFLSGSGSSDPDAACGDSIVSYTWTVNGLSFTTPNTTATLSWPTLQSTYGISFASGTYPMSLRVTDSFGLTNTATTTLTVYLDQNLASFTANPNPTACHQVVSFDGSGSHTGDPRYSLVSYQWDFGDGNSGSGVTTTHAFNSFGSYSVKLTVTDTLSRTISTNMTVLVNQGDNLPTAVSGGPYVIGAGNPLALNGSGSSDPDAACGDSIVSYTWTVNGLSFTIPNPTISISSSTLQSTYGISSAGGTYPMSLRVTDSLGLTSTNTTTLTIVNAPSSLAYQFNPVVYTKGATITVNTPSSNGGAVASYSVSPALPAGLSLDPTTGVISGTPTTVAATASYTVTASNIGGATTAMVTITVKDPPTLNIAAAGSQTALFWPASATNYVLQSTTNLASGNWAAVTNGTPNICITVSNATPTSFFRLQAQ